jgi:hypothetical protein
MATDNRSPMRQFLDGLSDVVLGLVSSVKFQTNPVDGSPQLVIELKEGKNGTQEESQEVWQKVSQVKGNAQSHKTS